MKKLIFLILLPLLLVIHIPVLVSAAETGCTVTWYWNDHYSCTPECTSCSRASTNCEPIQRNYECFLDGNQWKRQEYTGSTCNSPSWNCLDTWTNEYECQGPDRYRRQNIRACGSSLNSCVTSSTTWVLWEQNSPHCCVPVNCTWNDWQDDLSSLDNNGNVMRQIRTKEVEENQCGSCTGSSQQCRYYRDADGDGYGDPNTLSDWVEGCPGPPAGYVANNLDCNDNDDRVWNENVWWYKDQDGDQWYEHNSGVQSCNRPTEYHYVNTSESNYILRGTYNQICPGLENCNTRWIRNFLGGFDCNDTNPGINPGIIEQGFALCTDGIDNSCRVIRGLDGYDYDNPLCQINCDDGYTEWLRFSNNVLDGSTVLSRSVTGNLRYSHYFPLCLRSDAQIANSCVQGTLPVLERNSDGRVSFAFDTTSSTNQNNFCINAQYCNVVQGTICDQGMSKIATMSGETDSYLTHPSYGSTQFVEITSTITLDGSNRFFESCNHELCLSSVQENVENTPVLKIRDSVDFPETPVDCSIYDNRHHEDCIVIDGCGEDTVYSVHFDLCWQRNLSAYQGSYSNILSYCSNLDLGDSDSWRMSESREELTWVHEALSYFENPRDICYWVEGTSPCSSNPSFTCANGLNLVTGDTCRNDIANSAYFNYGSICVKE